MKRKGRGYRGEREKISRRERERISRRERVSRRDREGISRRERERISRRERERISRREREKISRMGLMNVAYCKMYKYSLLTKFHKFFIVVCQMTQNIE